MKKLNRKGFTLIELLAVIVILAIVMVVTIPSVLNAMDNAREGQLQNAADSVAEWFQKQYDLDTLSSVSGGAEAPYKAFLCTLNTETNTYENCASLTTSQNLSGDKGDAVLKAAGLGGGIADATGTVVVGSNKKVCVTLNATNNGKFKNDKSMTKTSSGC